MESNFEKADRSYATTQGIPYDTGSIMHYSSRAFSRNGQHTIVPVDPTMDPSELGQREGFSTRDLQHVQALYCEGERKEEGIVHIWHGLIHSFVISIFKLL